MLKEILIIKHAKTSNASIASSSKDLLNLNLPCKTIDEIIELCKKLKQADYDGAFVSTNYLLKVEGK